MHMNMAARALERVGDNAVDIGEQVGFLITGEFREFTDASHPVDAGAGGRRRHRILIVEDEESLADSVRYNLEREGYVVTVASTAGRRSNVPRRAAVPGDLGPDAA